MRGMSGYHIQIEDLYGDPESLYIIMNGSGGMNIIHENKNGEFKRLDDEDTYYWRASNSEARVSAWHLGTKELLSLRDRGLFEVLPKKED